MAYTLLSVEQDAKMIKGSKRGYLTGVLYLAPAMEADGVHNLCPMASGECKEAGQHVVRVVAEIVSADRHERLDQKPSADEKDEGQGHFACDQDTLRSRRA